MSRLTSSTTSKNTSLLLYRIPSRRHDTAPVTVSVAFCAALALETAVLLLLLLLLLLSPRTPFWKTKLLRLAGSVSCGGAVGAREVHVCAVMSEGVRSSCIPLSTTPRVSQPANQRQIKCDHTLQPRHTQPTTHTCGNPKSIASSSSS